MARRSVLTLRSAVFTTTVMSRTPRPDQAVRGSPLSDYPAMVQAHDQRFTHRYIVSYPEHAPREDDPHKADFEAWKRRRHEAGTYYCDFAHEHRGGDTSECDLEHPLEAHHKVIELALMNSVDFALLDADYPGISAQTVGTWIDGDQNLTLLCQAHHRGPGGVHNASASDYGSEAYVRDMITKAG